jgi:hypothetical protein
MRSILVAAAFSCACLPGEPVSDLNVSEPGFPVSNQSTKSARLDRAAGRSFEPILPGAYVLASADPSAIVVEEKRPETDALASANVIFEIDDAPETTAAIGPNGAERKEIDALIDRMIALPRIPADPDLAPPISKEALCGTMADAAQDNKLPVVFFNNLIWQESRFKPRVVSRAGAQGVAQFMPMTAQSVGLTNPFDPFQAIPASARFLKNLREKFGNLGLAAAAYNAGPGRVNAWLTKRSRLPAETRNYVQKITGLPAEHWRARTRTAAFRLPAVAPCRENETFAQADDEARQEEIRKAAEAEKARVAAATRLAKKPGGQKGFQLAAATKEPPKIEPKDQSRIEPNRPDTAAKLAARPQSRIARLAAKPVQLVQRVAATKPAQAAVKLAKKATAKPAAKKIHTASLKK